MNNKLYNTASLYSYCVNHIKKRWKKIEPFLLKSYYSVYYSKFILKARWKEIETFSLKQSEEEIAEYDYYYLLYIRDIVNCRHPRFEKRLFVSGFSNYCYFYSSIIKRRFPKLEKIILKDALYAIDYSLEQIKSRWKELEFKLKLNTDYQIYVFRILKFNHK